MMCRRCNEDDIACEGISAIRKDDVAYWKEKDFHLKLVAVSQYDQERQTLYSCVLPVRPCLGSDV